MLLEHRDAVQPIGRFKDFDGIDCLFDNRRDVLSKCKNIVNDENFVHGRLYVVCLQEKHKKSIERLDIIILDSTDCCFETAIFWLFDETNRPV